MDHDVYVWTSESLTNQHKGPTTQCQLLKILQPKLMVTISSQNMIQHQVLDAGINQEIITCHNLQHSIWLVLIQKNAIWYNMCTRQISAKDKKDIWQIERCWHHC